MRVAVKLFARARDVVGADTVELELPDRARVCDLRTALGERYPGMRPLLPGLLVAVGTEYAPDEMTIDPGVEIACFPPVSGG